MNQDKIKELLNSIVKFVFILALIIILSIIIWKLAWTDIYFDFTNFTFKDILLIAFVIFFLILFYLGFVKFFNYFEKREEIRLSEREFIEKILVKMTEFLDSINSIQKDFSNSSALSNSIEERLKEINDKLSEINSYLEKIDNQNAAIEQKFANQSIIQPNNTPDYIYTLMKKIISNHFEVSTIQLLPLEIFEFRLKKIINELDEKHISDLLKFGIVDSKRNLTEKGKSKFIELSRNF